MRLPTLTPAIDAIQAKDTTETTRAPSRMTLFFNIVTPTDRKKQLLLFCLILAMVFLPGNSAFSSVWIKTICSNTNIYKISTFKGTYKFGLPCYVDNNVKYYHYDHATIDTNAGQT